MKRYSLVWSLESSKKIVSIKKYLLEVWDEKVADKFLDNLRIYQGLVFHEPPKN